MLLRDLVSSFSANRSDVLILLILKDLPNSRHDAFISSLEMLKIELSFEESVSYDFLLASFMLDAKV